ncbi:MAG: YiiX/YebB-like N1pC/P60 family cysteine hydrolase [Propionibacteriaceae bacterium]|nr:YiiX/YebB-like N1pC/P60 family cysteine hydrolase [Propionibacteriaceae bacterium]
MRKITTGIAALVGLLSLSPSLAFANDTTGNPADPFARDPEAIQTMIDEANAKPILPDKASATNPGTAQPLAGFGSYPRRPGVILVTPDKYKKIIPTGHAAIIWSKKSVVEALAEGVVKRPNNWNNGDRNQVYGVTVRGTTAAQDNAASNWAYAQIGKPYNYYNTSTRSKFYCSQLVWAAFKDLYNIDLDTWRFGRAIHPMELVWTDRTHVIYRKV